MCAKHPPSQVCLKFSLNSYSLNDGLYYSCLDKNSTQHSLTLGLTVSHVDISPTASDGKTLKGHLDRVEMGRG